MTEVTPKRLAKLLEYEPETGSIKWRPRSVDLFSSQHNWKVWSARYESKEAGSYGKQGYGRINIAGRMLLAHRVAFALTFGRWPAHQIDHINGDRTDNRIANLREATPSQNSKNQKTHKRNTSGATGVSWHKASRKWQAHIGDSMSFKYLGLFDTFEAACAARAAAERQFEFRNELRAKS